ncbi:MAG: hypothetical protein ACYCQI_10545 [Gammaproteobacteria bacterium]
MFLRARLKSSCTYAISAPGLISTGVANLFSGLFLADHYEDGGHREGTLGTKIC